MDFTSTHIAGCFAATPQKRARKTPESVTFALNDVAAWREYLGADVESSSGASVTPVTAITIAAVWQAVAAKSHDAAKIPLCVFRRTEDGREELRKHPAARLIGLDRMANDELTAYQLWRRAYVHASLWGNGYVWIERRGVTPVALYNLLPDRTELRRAASGRLYVVTEWRDAGNAARLKSLPYEDVIHVDGMAWDESGGQSLIDAARETIGQALSQRKFTAKFFRNNATLGGVLQVPAGTQPEKITKLEDSFAERHAGSDKAFRVAVLRDGVKFQQTMATLQQSDAVQVDEQTARQVARFFNMPPSRLGVRESVSYNSQEADRRNYVDGTLTELLIPCATQCQAKLLTPQERDADELYVKHRIVALMWADVSTVNNIGVSGVQAGIYEPDEVRGWFELNALPNGAGKIKPHVEPSPSPAPPATQPNPAVDPPVDPHVDITAQQRSAMRATLDGALDRALKRLGVQRDKLSPERRTAEALQAVCVEQRHAVRDIMAAPLSVLRAFGATSLSDEAAVDVICSEWVRVGGATMDRPATVAKLWPD